MLAFIMHNINFLLYFIKLPQNPMQLLKFSDYKYIIIIKERLNMTAKETAKRYTLFIISLFFSAFGVAVTKHGELGVSPISSVANVMSSRSEAITLGTWLIIWNCLLILGQILILRKSFRPIQLLQIPISFLFGIFTDFGMMCVDKIPTDLYAVRLLLVVCGMLILAFGISLAVTADVIMNSGEAFVKAIADKSGGNFGKIKIGFDICCVVASVALSLLFFNGKIVGTREGTVITALFTGLAVNMFTGLVKEPLGRMLTK